MDVLAEIINRLLNAGPIIAPLAILVVVGAAREWFVWGHVYRQERAEKEYWREQALNSLGLAERSVDAAAEAVAEEILPS